MTTMDIDTPVPVVIDWSDIKNWAERYAKPRLVKRTTMKTYILDPAAPTTSQVQICDYEPSRVRMTIQVIDVAVALTLETPTQSPDTSAAGDAPQGRYLPPNVAAPDYEFFGPDAMWLNSLSAITRVTVTKEYC